VLEPQLWITMNRVPIAAALLMAGAALLMRRSKPDIKHLRSAESGARHAPLFRQ